MPIPVSAADQPLEVLVVGAGQAGLALGQHLARRGANFLLLDAGPQIGHSWRSRWDSLRLFSPAQYDSLPGLPFPAPADTHPSKDDVADYLQSYAAHFALPVRCNSPVLRLHPDADGSFTATTPTGTLRAEQVVVATGPFQIPHIPALAEQLDPLVTQLHSAAYRNPTQLPGAGRVLVVGAANSGLQIAAELAATRPVTVAVGSRPTELPQRIAGRDLFFWLTESGFFTVPAHTRIARRLRARGDIVIGTRSSTLRRRGIDFRPRLTGITGRTARFADGTTVGVDAVVWATGYRPDYSWLHVPGAVVDGRVRHTGGVTDVPGLYFLGLPWQTCRGSALLGFVGADAAALSARMAVDATAPAARAEPGRGPAIPAVFPA
ncbi:flavin-containing monooxygenase [Geodermatophilus obscurus]|uniref:FAD-dependent pyridine nucleotide-disulphide oxidoreductase n=1 Tax=Geodermatophilus obscurus (strain ATCC 25078 / DSM 43160 / JCM 3152 / CCUG 61914 / KCC A-0152 / KCTC 9177 / NBRC 13315 / NRRL B-3577 / G-20) TaxID=526225 RepID=D2SDB5_GEOOG|nr:NAD(P)-binding domain-containing protein [Geodermatophilus obscurus]ADB76464.1 FAD-dependent pyridine nucleotide-disulphide oxidoreductase [Geodermatophilus obscurus DSM 43160]